MHAKCEGQITRKKVYEISKIFFKISKISKIVLRFSKFSKRNIYKEKKVCRVRRLIGSGN